MSFTSYPFAALVAVTFALYYAPVLRQAQVLILVAASMVFYAWDQWHLLWLLLLTTGGSYLFLIGALKHGRRYLCAGITFNLLILACFKYKLLFIDPAHFSTTGSPFFDAILLLPLPVGISFFVFHDISMLVDLTKAREKAAPAPPRAALYIIFFPQLVSGPITQARGFLPQIAPKSLRDVFFIDALKWLIYGYFFKVFCANNLNQLTGYMSPNLYSSMQGLDRTLLLFLYSCQIYADFAGYSAIAIGIALLFGYRLPLNFNLPYLSRSFSEFWTRWHMSLSNWLRTYLYVPLGGNRTGSLRTYFNLMAVMLLGGLWHGAALSYLVWGGVHGALLVAERPFLGSLDRWRWLAAPRAIVVFVAVSWAWLFFKLPHFSDAVSYTSGMWPLTGYNSYFHRSFYPLAALYSAPVIAEHLLCWLRRVPGYIFVEPAIYAALLTLSIAEAGPDSAFIYFQF